MKTSEFIKEIKSMGVQVKELYDEIMIKDSEGCFVAMVSKVEFAVLSTDYRGFYRLDYNTKLRLLNLLIKYAKTPIEDREEEEKKYYLRHKGFKDYAKYLNYRLRDKTFTINDKSNSNSHKTQFTQKEIDELPECYTHPAVWEQIEVKE